MWSYKEVDKGYKLLYDWEEVPEDRVLLGLDIFIPYKLQHGHTVMCWNVEEMDKLVNGLNDGSIKINLDEMREGFNFHFNFPKGYEFNIMEVED